MQGREVFPQNFPSNHFAPDALAIGAILHGALVVTQILAQSNFAIIYAARDENLRRDVAVKEFFPFGCRRDGQSRVLPPPVSPPAVFADARAQFLEEARVLAQFHHPGIVAVHAFFQANNTAYMVMELLRGKTLGALLEERGPFPQSEVLDLAQVIGAALEEVHRARLLHRDLKPDNIFKCDDGRIVLLDFGLSTRLDEGVYGTRRLDVASRFGTPGYAPPEQYTQNSPQTTAGDIYSLGATLYHLLTGSTPAPAPDRAFGERLVAPTRLVANVTVTVSEAILQALRLKPGQRPPHVRAFLQLLSERENIEVARRALSGVLQARIAQLQAEQTFQKDLAEQKEVSKPNKNAANSTQNFSSATNQNPAPIDDSGCLQFAFVAYLIAWLFAAVVCVAWFFVQFLSRSW